MCPGLCAKPVGMWNRLETGCPFLPKQRFKHNVLNTSFHVIDKDKDINPVSYPTESKVYSILTMCKQWHVSCKQPTHGFFISCCHIIYLVRLGANFGWHPHYDGRALRGNAVLQYPPLHGPVHTPDNSRWDTPPV